MLAYRLLQAHAQPTFQEVPEPHAGPGEVVVRVAGSDLCHTDFTVISRDRSYWNNDPPPFTLGHEIAGWIEEVVGMAALGRLKILVDRYPLSEAKQAYDDFEHGRLVGRAVLMPETMKDADRGSTTSSRIAAASVV